jgi:endonuclease-3 related protein
VLIERFGPQGWWPGDSPFEVMVGSILTQNTNWKNVEKALTRLAKEGLLTPEKLLAIDTDILSACLRPVGYFRVKTQRLLDFVCFLRDKYSLDINRLMKNETSILRKELLEIRGIGPETADSILLYAIERPVFVVDAYTRRVLTRHRIIDKKADYDEIQRLFMTCLPEDVSLFNEYHALLVRVGKEYCRTRPLCDLCPLQPFLNE